MTYIFSQGTLASADEVNDNFNKLNKLTNEKAINDVSATNSGVLAGSSQVLIDKFLDANGQNNTVDTGNTTAVRQTYIYPNSFICTVGADTAVSLAQNAASALGDQFTSVTQYGGYLIVPSLNSTLISVTKHSSCTATKAYLYNATTTLIATATFSGNVATFSTPQNLTRGTSYQILAGSDGAGYTFRSADAAAYPYTNKFIVFITGRSQLNGSDNARAINIVSVNVYDKPFVDSTIQSVATTIPTGMTKVFVTPLMYEALSTGDSITADVSIDNGAHYTTGVPINTWSPITSANGTQLIVKANLLTNDGTTTPKVSGWRVLME